MAHYSFKAGESLQRHIERAAWLARSGAIRPSLSAGIRVLLEIAIERQQPFETCQCPGCGSLSGAPWCFRCERELTPPVSDTSPPSTADENTDPEHLAY